VTQRVDRTLNLLTLVGIWLLCRQTVSVIYHIGASMPHPIDARSKHRRIVLRIPSGRGIMHVSDYVPQRPVELTQLP
jgi:hypothetical protein